MRFTYKFIVMKFNELSGFVNNCETSIDQIQNNYSRQKQIVETEWKTKLQRLSSDYQINKKDISKHTEQMLSEALSISDQIAQIEQMLLMKDRYYRKTKIKKEGELRNQRNSEYDSQKSYFEILRIIKDDFEKISRKYRENILPGVIDGIHYFFSSKRKADYEELIILQNTVQGFILSIRNNIDQIHSDLLIQLEKKYRENKKVGENEYKEKLSEVEKAYVKNINEMTDNIEITLDKIFPNELIHEMKVSIKDYQDSLNRVYDKKLGTNSYFSVYGVYLPINKLGASGPIYQFMVDKLNELIVQTEIGSFLLMPVLGYTDNKSSWYFEWDNNNREFVQQLICDMMFSIMARVPIGDLKFNIIDPISRGTSIRSYFEAKNKIPELFGERILFNTQEIDNYLNTLSNYIDDIAQRILGARYNSVFEYSDAKSGYSPQIHYLVIFDFPKGMTESSLELLNNIIVQGPKCGVFTMIAQTYDESDVYHSQLFKKNIEEIKERCTHINVLGQKTVLGDTTLALLAQMPDRQLFNSYIDRYLLIRESIKNRALVFPKMLKKLISKTDIESIKKQIRYIDQFKMTIDENKCFYVENEIVMPSEICIGSVKYPTYLFEDSLGYEYILKEYTNLSNFATLPFTIDLGEELNILILDHEREHQKIIEFSHNILWSFFSAIPAGALKTCIIDLEGHGTNAIPFIDFSEKCSEVFCDGIISDYKRVKEELEELVKHIDEISLKKLGSHYRNILEYNSDSSNSVVPIILLVIYDFSKVLEIPELKNLLKIIKNGSRCGIYIILCGTELQQEKREPTKVELIDKIYQSCSILEPSSGAFKLVPFNVLLEPRQHLAKYQSQSFIEKYMKALEIVEERERNKAPENDYTLLFNLNEAPKYKRGNKKLHLPYGISADGELYYCDFENDNFAAFLCGSSGSGKSTLLHSLITGILMNNHPDDVEIWLADFKMKEFRRYVDHCPPHVKYILLEESQDAVYDFIDRMKEKLSERERMVGTYTDFAKAPVEQYMPLIFVIIDEFSIMSQIIDQNTEYKLIMQNLLAKGRALGFRFLFSSQTFTTGITGLTETAKKQIQMRLAMKCPREEIKETIEIEKSLMTEEQERWLLTLPKYYILLKKLVGEGSTVSDGKVQDDVLLTRAKGLYFPNYEIQNNYIEDILKNYHPDTKYNPTELYTYKDKETVVVDGSVYYSFEDAKEDIYSRLDYLDEYDPYSSDSMKLFLGRPRSMQKVCEVAVENELGENLILFGKKPELVTSVLLSSMESLQLNESDIPVEIKVISNSKNRVGRRLSEVDEYNKYSAISKEEEICEVIKSIRDAIDEGVEGNLYLYILGMDIILSNIGFLSESSGTNTVKRKKKASRKSKIDESKVFADNGIDAFKLAELAKAKAMALKNGTEDIEKISEKSETTELEQTNNNTENSKSETEAEEPAIYDIREDLEIILRDGPRLGYHIFAYFRSYDEFERLKYRSELFKHKIVFSCSKEESRDVLSSTVAFELGEIAFLYTDKQTLFTMRPYLHHGLEWDGWETDEFGNARRKNYI